MRRPAPPPPPPLGLHLRPQLGSTGGEIQHNKRLYSRLAVHEPTLIAVQRGQKKLRWAGRELVIQPGEMAALAYGQTFDVIHEPDSGGLYQAQWIAFDQNVVEHFSAHYGTAEAVRNAVKIARNTSLAASFTHAASILADETAPAAVVETALHSVLAWAQHYGIGFTVYERMDLVRQIRKMIAADTALGWSATIAAEKLNMSEATLRRRLAQSGTSFSELLIDVRMMRALTLLQVTPWPVARVADAVGYASPSRFTARFTERFGFGPSAVRAGDAAAADNRRETVVNVGLQP